MKIIYCIFVSALFVLAQTSVMLQSQCNDNCNIPIPNCFQQEGDQCISCYVGYEPVNKKCEKFGDLVSCNQYTQVCTAQKFSRKDLQKFHKDKTDFGSILIIDPHEYLDPFFGTLRSWITDQYPVPTVKHDGQYIYMFNGDEITIFEGYPAENAKILSSLKVGYKIKGIEVHNNNVCIFGSESYNSTFINITVIDVEDRTNPRILKEYAVSGNYVSKYQLNENGYIYFVIVTYSSPELTFIPEFIIDGLKSQLPIENLYIYHTYLSYHYAQFITVFGLNMNDVDSQIGMLSFLHDFGGYPELKIHISEEAIYVSYDAYPTQPLHKILIKEQRIVPTDETIGEQNPFDQTPNQIQGGERMFKSRQRDIKFGKQYSQIYFMYSQDIILGLKAQNFFEHKIVLLDIKGDPENPKVLSEVTLEDHDFSVFDYNRLFLSKSKNILLIPYGFKALLFHISRNFIEFKGIISHTITSDVHEYVGFMESFIIEEMLYTKSRCEIQIHRIYNTKYIGSLYTPGCIKT